jgi:hypothetical protein
LNGKLVLIGAGKMGTAMLEGWLKAGVRGDQVIIFDPAPPPETLALIEAHGITHNPDPASVSGIEVILVAIKPQMVDDVLPGAQGRWPAKGRWSCRWWLARQSLRSNAIWAKTSRSSAPSPIRLPPWAAASPPWHRTMPCLPARLLWPAHC